MDTYTVAFFGHRELSDALAVEERLKLLLRNLICNKEYVEFLVGRDGEFDQLAAFVSEKQLRSLATGIRRLC